MRIYRWYGFWKHLIIDGNCFFEYFDCLITVIAINAPSFHWRLFHSALINITHFSELSRYKLTATFCRFFRLIQKKILLFHQWSMIHFAQMKVKKCGINEKFKRINKTATKQNNRNNQATHTHISIGNQFLCGTENKNHYYNSHLYCV